MAVASGRPRSARTADNIESVVHLLCSQEDQPGTSKSTRRLASDLIISERSVRRIAKHDLSLSAFRGVPAQVINAATNWKQKRLERCKRLLRRLSVTACKRVFFTDEKHQPTGQHSEWQCAGRKRDVSPSRLLIERAKFASRVMVSVCVCKARGTCTLFRKSLRSISVATRSRSNLREWVATEINGRLPPFARPTFHISARWSGKTLVLSDRLLPFMYTNNYSILWKSWDNDGHSSNIANTITLQFYVLDIRLMIHSIATPPITGSNTTVSNNARG